MAVQQHALPALPDRKTRRVVVVGWAARSIAAARRLLDAPKASESGNRTMFLQRLVTTLTNTATGASVTVSGGPQFKLTDITLDNNGSFTFSDAVSGVNFLYHGPDGVQVSAGHATITGTVVFDANGNVVSFDFDEHLTPHFTHFYEFVCPLLGGTAPPRG